MMAPALSPTPSEAHELRLALRATSEEAFDLWIRLRELVAPTAPLDALAISVRLFERRVTQLDAEKSDGLLRLKALQPFRLLLAEDLLATGAESEAKRHVRKLLGASRQMPLPTNLSDFPHLSRWLQEPWHMVAVEESRMDSGTVARWTLRATRLLVEEPLIESPALLVYRHHGQSVRLLLPDTVAAGPHRLVFASAQVFHSLEALPAGTTVQVRMAAAFFGCRPVVFGVAPRPQVAPWEGLPDEPGVVWRVERAPGRKRDLSPVRPFVLVILSGGERAKVLLEHFIAAGLPHPQPGDAIRVRRLPAEVKDHDRVVAVGPDPHPTDTLWRPFFGRLLLIDNYQASVAPNIALNHNQIPREQWITGQLVEGIATLWRLRGLPEPVWRAACVKVVGAPAGDEEEDVTLDDFR